MPPERPEVDEAGPPHAQDLRQEPERALAPNRAAQKQAPKLPDPTLKHSGRAAEPAELPLPLGPVLQRPLRPERQTGAPQGPGPRQVCVRRLAVQLRVRVLQVLRLLSRSARGQPER